MNQTEKILFEQLQRHATHYIESSERGIVVDDLDVDSFIAETSKLVTANGDEQSDGNCNIPHVVEQLPQQICYKTNEPCKYNCQGLCKESC